MKVAAILAIAALLMIPRGAVASSNSASFHVHLLPADPHSPAFVVRNEGVFTFGATIDSNGTVTLDRDSNFGCVHLWPGATLSRRHLIHLLRFAEHQGFFDLPHTIFGKDAANTQPPQSVTIYTRTGEKTVDEMPFATNAHFDAVHAAIMQAAGVSFDCS